VLRVQTQARELALKALYQRDLLGTESWQEPEAFCREYGSPQTAPIALELVNGYLRHRRQVDELIRRTAENWELERMPTSDRNILRLGVYELLYRTQTPPKVAINEAIELAKRFSTEHSATFVNGVMDSIYNDCLGGENADGRRQLADLHVHSTASDGSVEPQLLPALAARAGLAAFALTDHDTVRGVAAAIAAAPAGLEVIAGVELTGYGPAAGEGTDVEIHIGGLFIDHNDAELLEKLEHLQERRRSRMRQMGEKLRALGIEVDVERICQRVSGSAVGRVHLAEELVERGYCRDLSDAFERYLGEGGPAYVPKERLTPPQAIELVLAAGGCPVLCHPGLTGVSDDYVRGLAGSGLEAIEVHCPSHSPEDEKRFLDLARELDLAVTGGSDFHGEAKPDIHLGQEAVSIVELERLKRRRV